MALNLELVGQVSEPMTHAYTARDCILYALGVGAKLSGGPDDELAFLSELEGPKVLPTFAVVPSFTAMVGVLGKLGANMMMVVHGEQTIRLHRAIPPSGTFRSVAEVTAIHDKGKGAVVVVQTRTSDDQGAPVFDNVASIFVRGAGGFGGERGPEAVPHDPPEGLAPDFEVTEATAPEQAALYRLSGDLNPLHISPSLAKLVGFDRPILHGLCTYGYAGRAVLRGACAGDVTRLRSFAARFSAPVVPGDTLTTQGWRIDGDRYVVRVLGSAGKVVLSNGVAEVTAPA